MAQGIPDSLRPLWDDLQSEVVFIHERWIYYRQLYARSEKRIELLNETAAHFFGVLEFVLFDDTVLALSRLIDPAGNQHQKNAVLEQLVVDPEVQAHPALAQELGTLLDMVKAACESFRRIRNKRIAHRDLHVALGLATTPLPGVSRQTVEDALKAIRAFMNCIQGFFEDAETLYEEFASTEDGDALVEWLRRGKAYEEAEMEGLIPMDYVDTTAFHDA